MNLRFKLEEKNGSKFYFPFKRFGRFIFYSKFQLIQRGEQREREERKFQISAHPSGDEISSKQCTVMHLERKR